MNKLDPTPGAVALWLKQLNRDNLHDQGWIKINKRFHGITLAVRPFLRNQFPDEKERQAAFDGLTLALMSMERFEDIDELTELFNGEWTGNTADKRSPKATDRP